MDFFCQIASQTLRGGFPASGRTVAFWIFAGTNAKKEHPAAGTSGRPSPTRDEVDWRLNVGGGVPDAPHGTTHRIRRHRLKSRPGNVQRNPGEQKWAQQRNDKKIPKKEKKYLHFIFYVLTCIRRKLGLLRFFPKSGLCGVTIQEVFPFFSLWILTNHPVFSGGRSKISGRIINFYRFLFLSGTAKVFDPSIF